MDETTSTQAQPLRARELSCRPGQIRRLTIASLVFVAAVGTIVALVTVFVLRDLSEGFISSVVTQAKQEAEAVASLAGDPQALGEGDVVSSLEAPGGDSPIDADALIAQFLPGVLDEQGRPLEPLTPTREPAAGETMVMGQEPGVRRVPATLSRRGWETEFIVNGQLLRKQAFHFLEIRHPGGKTILDFRKVDLANFDPAILAQENDPKITYNTNRIRPSTQRVTIAWQAMVSGEPVQLTAGIDKAIIDEGIAELRRRTIPKVVAGGVLFVLLMLAAYLFVVSLLRESRRLEAEANQQALLAQVGMLAAGLAHEIRNPLSAVQMNLQLIEEDLSAPAPARPPGLALAMPGGAALALDAAAQGDSREHLSLLRSTQKEIRRLGSLVSDFLTYARPQAPRRAPHSLDAVVRDGVQLFDAAAKSAGIRLVPDLEAGDAPVLMDEAMIKQALMNVLVNALEAVRRPGGTVTVSTRRHGSRCQVIVRDDGPGLPADPEAVFAVFHSTKKGGTGLGLAIARALVERQGGTLEGRSADPGAEFVMTLPADPA